MTIDLPLAVAAAARSAALPHLGRPEQRAAAGFAVGGDTTFAIDHIAERAVAAVLEDAGEVAWYTEDIGLVIRGRPKRLLVVDPIDGTRPAGAGLESACVSVAVAPFTREAVLGDVEEGIVLEIKSGTLFRARRGRGVRIVRAGETRWSSPSSQTRIPGSFWIYGLRGRPAVASAVMLADLIDATGVPGGTFDLGSAAFAMTRVVTGQADAYVDHGQRIIDELPSMRAQFEALAGGAVLNNSPYDVAAAALICTEAGCVVTDAHGRPLDGRPMLGSDASYQVSTLAVCTPELHAEILAELDRGMARLKAAGTLADGLASG